MRCAVVAAGTAWLLWRGIAPVIPDAPTEGAGVLQSYETKDACLAAATVKRTTRNAVILNGKPACEVFTCLPEGADPARARFE